MSKLVMWNLMTLDGTFDGATPWDLDWHNPVVDQEFNRLAIDLLHSADRLLFGRVTYEGMAAYWSNAQGEIADLMNSLPKFVFTRTGKGSVRRVLRPDRTYHSWQRKTLVRIRTAPAFAEIARSPDHDLGRTSSSIQTRSKRLTLFQMTPE
jgi:dihydrofolate reductase